MPGSSKVNITLPASGSTTGAMPFDGYLYAESVSALTDTNYGGFFQIYGPNQIQDVQIIIPNFRASSTGNRFYYLGCWLPVSKGQNCGIYYSNISLRTFALCKTQGS